MQTFKTYFLEGLALSIYTYLYNHLILELRKVESNFEKVLDV